MEINFDFLLSGCNTRCKHCYVNGGPGPMMPLEDALLCIEKLECMGKYLPEGTSFTLDHEPMNHPDLGKILRAAAQNTYCRNYHHGMTSGIALMHRGDRDAIVQTYFDCGCRTFGITIHGTAEHHDEIVRRSGAFEKSMSAAEFLRQMGAEVEVSLMLNRFFAEDAEDITRTLESLHPHKIYLAIPIFTPHANMMDFEPYRATVETWEALQEVLPRWGCDPQAVQKAGNLQTAQTAVARLRTAENLEALFSQPQEELYLTIHPDCKLYVGNSGGETQCLGDLRTLSPEAAAERIHALPGNRDYTAYYDLAALPSMGALLDTLGSLPQNLIYGDFESVLYRGLVEMGIPTRLISCGKDDSLLCR